MGNETKKHENNFKFGLYQVNGEENNIVVERIFSADVYNQATRYFIDIREKLSETLSKLSKTLSKRHVNTVINGVDVLKVYEDSLVKYEIDNKLISPDPVMCKRGNSGIEFEGVEFKFCFFYNENLVVERSFGVQHYNPDTRFSLELMEVINTVVDDIQEHILKQDRNNMWDDYDIIKTYGLKITQIRDLDKNTRADLLHKMNNKDYVWKIRKDYKVNYHDVTVAEPHTGELNF